MNKRNTQAQCVTSKGAPGLLSKQLIGDRLYRQGCCPKIVSGSIGHFVNLRKDKQACVHSASWSL